METIRQLLYNVTCFHYNAYRSAGILPYGETRTYNNVAIMAGTLKGGHYLTRPQKATALAMDECGYGRDVVPLSPAVREAKRRN